MLIKLAAKNGRQKQKGQKVSAVIDRGSFHCSTILLVVTHKQICGIRNFMLEGTDDLALYATQKIHIHT
jgi:hypothetical protein